MQLVFYASLALLAYTYVGYPILAAALARLIPRPHRREPIEPTVSLVILAYNEERDIGRKLDNALNLDYPADKLEIVVASDGSTDRTDEIVRGYADRGVRLFRANDHPGKAATTNQAVATATGEILVFSDATGEYDRGVVRAFVRNFADPEIGAANGRVLYRYGGSTAAEGFRAYQKLVVSGRRAESEWGTETSLSGSCCALRRALFRPIPSELDFDFCHPLHVAQEGARTVYEAEAVSTEDAREVAQSEFAARVRMAILAYSFIPYLLRGLTRVRDARYVFQVVSHKLLRWLSPLILVVLLVTSAWLAATSPLAALVLGAQLAVYAGAALGYLLPGRGVAARVFGVPLFFVTINLAFLAGLRRYLRGERVGAWTPERGT